MYKVSSFNWNLVALWNAANAKSVIGKDSSADSKGGWKVERTRRREPRKCRNFALLSFWRCCSATFAFKLEYISQKLPHKPQWHNCIYIWKLGSLQIVKPDITDDDTFNDHCEIFRKKRKAIFIQSTVQSISYVRNAQKGLSLKRKNILNLACSSIFILLVHFMFWSISFDVKFSKTHFIKFHYSNISSLSRVFSYKYRREDTISGNHVQNQTWAQDWQLFNLCNKREYNICE